MLNLSKAKSINCLAIFLVFCAQGCAGGAFLVKQDIPERIRTVALVVREIPPIDGINAVPPSTASQDSNQSTIEENLIYGRDLLPLENLDKRRMGGGKLPEWYATTENFRDDIRGMLKNVLEKRNLRVIEIVDTSAIKDGTSVGGLIKDAIRDTGADAAIVFHYYPVTMFTDSQTDMYYIGQAPIVKTRVAERTGLGIQFSYIMATSTEIVGKYRSASLGSLSAVREERELRKAVLDWLRQHLERKFSV